MSYSDEWFKAVHAARQHPTDPGSRFAQASRAAESPKPVEPRPVASPHWHHPDGSTTWKPWAEMTAEERRKALETREEKKDATPSTASR